MSRPRLFDIAANLSDKSYQGIYHKKASHQADVELVLARARSYGVSKFLLAGGNLKQSEKAFNISKLSDDCFCTVGVHPCLANTVAGGDYFQKLSRLIVDAGPKCAAIGECGLDYDRLHFSDKATQLQVFPQHFDLAERFGLPMYLHSRNTNGDFAEIVRANRHKFSNGVVHSFTGDLVELRALLDMDLFIGVNGCSLKTQENLEVVREIPLEKIMLETDCPYCEIRKSSPAHKLITTQFNYKPKEKYSTEALVRGRNEPCTIVQVLEAVARIKGVTEEELARVSYANSCGLFKIGLE